MIDLLTPLGFEARAISDAVECLALAPGFRPDLFLLDLSMPGEDGLGMDGRELALSLRETEAGQARIIFVSGEAQRGEMQRGGAPGFDLSSDPGLAGCAVLGKPVDLAVLLREIGVRLELTWLPPVETAMRRSAEQLAGLRALAETCVPWRRADTCAACVSRWTHWSARSPAWPRSCNRCARISRPTGWKRSRPPWRGYRHDPAGR